MSIRPLNVGSKPSPRDRRPSVPTRLPRISTLKRHSLLGGPSVNRTSRRRDASPIQHPKPSSIYSLQESNMIDLYTDATPNGLKISVALEELGLKYNVHRIFLGGDQKTPEFTAMNPNNKIPVLVDDGLVVTESGAILMYLAEKTGKLLPTKGPARTKTIEMVMF